MMMKAQLSVPINRLQQLWCLRRRRGAAGAHAKNVLQRLALPSRDLAAGGGLVENKCSMSGKGGVSGRGVSRGRGDTTSLKRKQLSGACRQHSPAAATPRGARQIKESSSGHVQCLLEDGETLRPGGNPAIRAKRKLCAKRGRLFPHVSLA